MAEEIRDLIEKINEEGIKAAEEKAREIENQAASKADAIVKKAKEKMETMLADARSQAAQTEEKTKALLVQAGRDLILSLRKEINTMLERLIIHEADLALGPANLEHIITEIVKKSGGEEDIIINLKKEDLEILEKKFLVKLKQEIEKGITLQPSMQIRAGFTISFDKGKSYFDFTDKALAEYIGKYLKPKLNDILNP
ncbi:MAG: hypothetical protein PHO42_01945 [Candidatus Omnitrophica bacterium]|nr:hypothetical protein [Candidatus Omnitrophota bacterium]